jgi:hypothetical protein
MLSGLITWRSINTSLISLKWANFMNPWTTRTECGMVYTFHIFDSGSWNLNNADPSHPDIHFYMTFITCVSYRAPYNVLQLPWNCRQLLPDFGLAHEFAIVLGPTRSDSIFRRAGFRMWGPGISSKAKSNGQNVLLPGEMVYGAAVSIDLSSWVRRSTLWWVLVGGWIAIGFYLSNAGSTGRQVVF